MVNTEIISVSNYLDKLNQTLKGEGAKIVGEVSGAHLHPSGHLYFSLLDKLDRSKIECMMWKSNYSMSGVEIKDGIEVVARVTPDIYKPWGRFSAKVEMVELVGEGQLKIAYEKLKKKLELEGVFLEENKKSLPMYPHRIGVITSKSGAVINDFLSNIGKFGFEILFVDSKVEGQDAIKDLLSAVETLKDKKLDVLVIMRGGGSLESFQAFNNEMLVRAVSSFPAPTLTGIGHDKDAPLVSMVSDKNVSTPTAVANLLNSTWFEANSEVRISEQKIFSQFLALLEQWKGAEKTLVDGVGRIESSIVRISDSISLYTKELFRGFDLLSMNTRDFLNQSLKSIELSSPERQLSQGYSIVRNEGKVIRSVKNIKRGDELDITVLDGIIKTKSI